MPAQTVKRRDTPSVYPDATARSTGLAIGDGGTIVDAPREHKRMFHSKSVPTWAIDRRRKLQESQASSCETSVSVTSSIFPLLEGCLSSTVVDGFDKAYVSDTGFVGYGELTIPQVDGYDAGVRASSNTTDERVFSRCSPRVILHSCHGSNCRFFCLWLEARALTVRYFLFFASPTYPFLFPLTVFGD